MPVLLVPVPLAVLGSSQAPVLGTVLLEQLRMYSLAWHRCEPGNSLAHWLCILGRPPAPPLVVAEVKPTKRTLTGVLQQASTRDVLQYPEFVTKPLDVTQVPL
jgi:hypothetical protein